MKQESTLKTSLRIIFLYVLVLVLGTVFCAAVYTVYLLCMNMISGGGLKIFNLGYFLRGINTYGPLMFVACGIVMCLYFIRYSICKALPVTVVVIAYVATWFFVIPLDYALLTKYTEKHPPVSAEKSISADYFRVGDSGAIFYYSSVENDKTDGVCIDTTGQKDEVYTFSGVSIPKEQARQDSLIHKSIGMPWAIELVVSWVKMFTKISRQAWESGFLGWLCFSSISLSLAAVLGLCFVSKWRMVNVLSVCIATVGILILNVLAYTKSFLDPAKAFVDGALSKLPIKNPLIVLMNVLIFVILSLVGLIVLNKRRKEEKSSNVDPYGKEFA